jgi:TAK1-binding protein 1
MSARAEPVIAEPEIHGGIELDESCRYLAIIILASLTIYNSEHLGAGLHMVQMTCLGMFFQPIRQLACTFTIKRWILCFAFVICHVSINLHNLSIYILLHTPLM